MSKRKPLRQKGETTPLEPEAIILAWSEGHQLDTSAQALMTGESNEAPLPLAWHPSLEYEMRRICRQHKSLKLPSSLIPPI